MKLKYQDQKFNETKLKKIQIAAQILTEYQAKGYNPTLRMIYYQFVARGHIPNNEREYKQLGDAISDGRMAGLIDWDYMTDRMRTITETVTWDSPAAIINAVANQFKLDKWEKQPYYVEVWIEKDALLGVIEPICRQLEVPFMACRGYMSSSAVWEAGYQRFKPKLEDGKECLLLYMGDHDPSGIDMTRDVADRMKVFAEGYVEVKRLALNYEQVEEFSPPPNPTKMTDSRATGYLATYGETCWELDALNPDYISDLVEEAVLAVRDEDEWNAVMADQTARRAELKVTAQNWDKVVKFLEKQKPKAKPDEESE